MADKPEEHNPLVGYVQSRFQQAETSRLYDEKRWLKAYRNYRGLYGPEMAFRDSEKSKVFVKVTKTKVLAAFGQIIEVLFGSGKLFGIEVLGDPTVGTGLYSMGYMNNGLMLLPPSSLIIVGIYIWIQRSRNTKLIETH